MALEPALVLGPLARALVTVQADTARRRRDAEALGALWQRTLDATVRSWAREVSPGQVESVERQIEAAVTMSHPAALARISVSAAAGTTLISGAMGSMAAAGVVAVQEEAARAGLELEAPPPLAVVALVDWATAAADVLAAGLAFSAGREALRLWRPGIAAADVVTGVRAHLGKLSDRSLRDAIGGALTRAQNLGKLAAYARRPPQWTLTLYADETLDANTCAPCRRIDGEVLPSVDAAVLAYGGAGYLLCEGGERCRGTVRGEWTRDEPARDAWPLREALARVGDRCDTRRTPAVDHREGGWPDGR